MPPETVLLESRTLRDTLIGRTDVLDKVKALALLPDGLHLTTRMVADYFEVGERAINSVLRRHRAELAQHGMRILKASDLREFHSVNMTPWKRSYPQAPVHLTVYTRRTVLGVAMLLRDSEVARAVRRYLLDVEEEWRSTRRAAVSARPESAEGAWQEAARALRELAPLVGRMSVRLERMERRLGATDRVVAALGYACATSARTSVRCAATYGTSVPRWDACAGRWGGDARRAPAAPPATPRRPASATAAAGPRTRWPAR